MTTKYYRPTAVNVNLQAVNNNFQAVRRLHPDKTVIAVVKANGYGLGAVQLASYLTAQGADFFAVATLDEAIELRMHGIKAKILILGVIRPEDINKAHKHRLALTVPSVEWLEQALSHLKEGRNKPLWLHLKLDTGMNRIGMKTAEEYGRAIAIIHEHERLRFEGVFTHFSSADEDNTLTQQAYEYFLNIVNQFERPNYVHCQNSATALRFNMPECNAVRLGIAMYGYYPSAFIREKATIRLQPAMQLVSTVNFVKEIEAGETVSYGATYTGERRMKVATLPIGYADGFLRSMQGYAINIKGHDCEIIGRVCMDQMMAAVPADVQVGDQAVLIDHKSDSAQSMEVVERKQQTISYEVLCNLSRRLPRIYHTHDEQMIYNELLK